MINKEEIKIVNAELLDVVEMELTEDQIIKAIDKDGNWLHHKWCKLPYNEKVNGCRNFNICKDMVTFNKFSKEPYILNAMKWNYKKYIRDMKKLHPSWSYRQLGNIWYYQIHCRRLLGEKSNRIKYNLMWSRKWMDGLSLQVMTSPEVNGVNVLATLLRLGYKIERIPKNYVWFVHILFTPNEDYIKYSDKINVRVR